MKYHPCESKWLVLLLHLAIYAILQIAYVVYVSVLFEYEGYINQISFTKSVAGASAVAFAAILLPRKYKPSAFFLHLILVAAVTPAMVFMGGADAPWEFGIVFFLAFLLVAVVGSQDVDLPLPSATVTPNFLMLVTLGVASLTVVIVALLGGYRFLNFDFSQVYEFRREAADSLPSAFAYILPTVTKAIIPVGIVLAYQQQRIATCIALVGCSFLLAAMSNHKAPFFYPLIVLGGLALAEKSQPITWLLVIVLSTVAVGSVAGLLVVIGEQEQVKWIGTLVIRRLLFLPALLSFFHWEFFSGAEYIYWADSRLSLGITDNPHGEKMAVLIGIEYFGRDVNANSGWVGSGMGQAGYFGVGLYSIGLACLLLLGNRLAERLGPGPAVGLFVLPVLTGACVTDFSLLFVSHGTAVLILLASCVSREPGQRPNDRLLAGQSLH
jgi:hypothetical protein